MIFLFSVIVFQNRRLLFLRSSRITNTYCYIATVASVVWCSMLMNEVGMCTVIFIDFQATWSLGVLFNWKWRHAFILKSGQCKPNLIAWSWFYCHIFGALRYLYNVLFGTLFSLLCGFELAAKNWNEAKKSTRKQIKEFVQKLVLAYCQKEKQEKEKKKKQTVYFLICKGRHELFTSVSHADLDSLMFYYSV